MNAVLILPIVITYFIAYHHGAGNLGTTVGGAWAWAKGKWNAWKAYRAKATKT